MDKITLSIYVPCFNEENNIVNTLNCIKEGVQNISCEVLVVDDASKDKTINMVEKFKEDNPDVNIKILRNENNKGIGFNYYAAALKASGKYYMQVTGDNADPPSEIKKLVNNIGKADMILTYLIDGRKTYRRILSRLFVVIINVITFNSVKYYNGPNIFLLESVKLYGKGSSGFGHQAELITKQIRKKKSYIQIEIKPYVRPSEKSKSLTSRNIPSVIKSLVSIFLNQIIYVTKKIFKIN